MKEYFKDLRFNFINFFAFMLVVGIFFYFVWSSQPKFSIPGKEPNRNISEIRIVLSNVLLLIVGFFFGSSKSSAKKDETIQQMQTSLANSNTKILTEDDLQKFPQLAAQGYKIGDTVSLSLLV